MLVTTLAAIAAISLGFSIGLIIGLIRENRREIDEYVDF